MPRRRPPREGLGVNNLIIFAVAILFLSCQVEAQQQQRPAVLQRHESPHEDPDALHRLEATTIRPQIETPHISERRKSTISINNNNKRINHDASAIATLAPAGYPAVSAPPARRSPTGGLTSLHIARSLEDWEVEDFVLLATVDGGLHARDRKTGKPIWNFNLNDPMVQTTFHRRDRSATQNGSNAQDFYTPSSIDDYIWIVEPSRDGSLYIYRPGGPDPGLIHTGLTMKKLVEELSPFADEDPAVTYTGSKQTQMMVIDARDGRILKHFGGPGPNVVKSSCLNPTGVLNMESGECSSSTFTIGRTEYKVDIGGMDGREIATLKFFEWTPNNYDLDLLEKYHTTLDNKYIYTSHDGGVIGFDHERSNTNEPGRLFKHKFESPVARVFDVAKPWGSEDNDANLILLPQPIPPIHMEDEVSRDRRASSIFLNHTVDGSWYAMSGTFYPMAVQGIGPARCEQQDWKEYGPSWDTLDDSEISRALVGLHSIDRGASERLLTINAPAPGDNRSENASTDHAPALRDDPSFLERIQLLPGIAVNSLLEFIKNPMLIILLIAVLGSNQRQLRTWVGRFGKNHTKLIESPVTADMPEAGPILPAEKTVKIPAVDGTADTPVVKIVEVHPTKGETHKEDGDPEDDNADWQKVSRKDSLDAPSLEDPAATPKKRARGRRGGVKHKKGNKERTASTDGSQDLKKVRDRAASVDASQAPNPPPTVDDAVRDAQKLGEQKQTLEPDTMTISNNPADISGPIIKIGALTVNTEKLIGTGSNGTMVFEGDFDGRAVAVKRMLIQFFDIASQETKLLRESDDHPNVIRYFAQQQASGFLYIALELCPASLADVIDKPNLHRALAQSGERDLPHVLYQIANGLQHLHNLRIVHRDLKPQNILVTMGKDGRPRVLVSDFGLCKKLEGEQSSFRATTAHAAGTSGWRAPELLLDDDARDGGTTVVDASTNGESSGPLVNAELMPNRRATRAIDIFSLGLVFFYVLTKGSHPFDCGDRYMREVNIRKGKFNLKNLEVLGDFAEEAKELIGSMLKAEPKLRPNARNVMAHPFFWSAKKRLNFLCDVSDHFEKETRDPPSPALRELENWAPSVCGSDFLKHLPNDFKDSLGKQRKYTGTKLLDLLRALRNKKNHYEDMSEKLKKEVGALPDGYLGFWTRKFPNLLICCWNVVYDIQWDETDRFREYYLPAGL